MAKLKNTISSSTDYTKLPAGTTAQRPTSPVKGMMRFNTTLSNLEYYNGAGWVVGGAARLGSQSNPAPSAAAIKAADSSVTSDVYWLYSSSINSGTPFQCYCDFTMDGGIGYAIYFQQFFNAGDGALTSEVGYEPGPNFTSMSSNAISGTPGYSNEFNIYPNLIPVGYNNGAGASRMIIFNRANNGSSSGGITSSTYVYTKLTGLTSTAMRDIWKAFPATAAYTATYATFASAGLRSGGTGTVYIQGAHGSSGGVNQWVSGASSNVNTNLVFEYKPIGYAEDTTRGDPNHYWMVDNGDASSTYFRGNNQYGTSGVLNTRWGGIAIY